MAVSRLPRRWFLPTVIVGLAGLYALGASVTWLVSMLEEPDTGLFAVPFAGAALACLILIVAIPLLHMQTLPRWAQIALPLFVGVFTVIAAWAVWLLTLLLACDVDGLCRPVDTWKALPSLLTCGILTASGPGLAALSCRTHGQWRGRFWVGAVVLGVLGFVIALAAWVEFGLFPFG